MFHLSFPFFCMYLHLDGLGTVNLDAGSLANDLGGIDKIIQDLLVDSSKSAGSWASLLLARVASRLGHDAALSNKENVTVRELLLELTGESLLNLVEGLELRNRDKDDDSLLATTNLDLNLVVTKNLALIPFIAKILSSGTITHLLGRRDLKGSEFLLELSDIVLKIEKSLSNAQFDFIGWGSASRLSNLVRGHGV